MVIVIGNGHSDISSNPGKICLHFTFFSFQLWINCRANCALHGNQSKRRKILNSSL